MMEEWKEYRLDEVCKSIADGDHMPPPKVKRGIPFVTISNIKDNRLDLSDTYFVPQEYYDALDSKRKPQMGDTIYSVVGTFGKPVYIKDNNPFVFQRHIAILRPDASFLNPLFLYYTLLSPQFYTKADIMAIGAVQRTISLTSLRNATIQIPSLTVQEEIVSKLKTLDDKIEVNRRINDNLEQQAQALFKSWFVDFEPFKDGEFVDSELGMIPKGWRVVSLGDLMCYNGGSQPPASEFIEEYKEGYIRFIQIRDYASDSHITYIPISKRNKLCDVKDIMIARYGASLGRICYGLKGAYNVALAKVTPIKDYYREYLRCFLNTREFYEGINNKGNRAVQAGFNQSDIQSFRIPFPADEDILKRFENLCSSYFERRLLNVKESRHLTTLRDTLLPKLMSGELKVNEIEI